MVQRIQSSEDLLHSRDLDVVSQELLHLPGPSQLLLDLLGAGQVVVDGGRLDGQTALHHEASVPLCLGGILVRVVAAPHVDHADLALVYHQSLVLHRLESSGASHLPPPYLGQISSLTKICQSLPDHEHLRALPPDLELVELLITDVVGDVLHQEEDDGLRLTVELPGLHQGPSQALQGVVMWELDGNKSYISSLTFSLKLQTCSARWPYPASPTTYLNTTSASCHTIDF